MPTPSGIPAPATLEAGMVTMCDACGSARALTSWIWCAEDDPAIRELTFCGHCNDGRAEALVDAAWVQVEDGRVEQPTSPVPSPQH